MPTANFHTRTALQKEVNTARRKHRKTPNPSRDSNQSPSGSDTLARHCFYEGISSGNLNYNHKKTQVVHVDDLLSRLALEIRDEKLLQTFFLNISTSFLKVREKVGFLSRRDTVKTSDKTETTCFQHCHGSHCACAQEAFQPYR